MRYAWTTVILPCWLACAGCLPADPGPGPGPGPDASGIPLRRRTLWNPGIPGGIPQRETLCATVSPQYASSNGLTPFALDGTGNARPAIQHAMDRCPPGQVVFLPAGTYRLTAQLSFNKGITLRGAGARQTKLLLTGSTSAVIYLWPGAWPTYGAAVNVTADVPKGATEIPVESASSFAVGDIIQIDQDDDDSYLFYGGVPYFKRPNYGPATPGGRPRSMGQTVEITGIAGNVLTVSPGIHLGFTHSHMPQVFKPNATLKHAGVEDLYVTGGTVHQIHVMCAAYSWVKGVESDGTVESPSSNGTAGPGLGMTGSHVQIERSFRITVRDSYFHHATHVVQGGGAYGVSLSMHTSDSLIENNIIYYMNKPFTLRASGGGNVIAYNYVDDAWTSADPSMQETTIDLGHASFPYMELAEGNYTAQIATENVWGNSGWMTLFRNYATGQQTRSNQFESYQLAAIALEVKAREMNIVGNVLGTPEHVGIRTGAAGFQVYEVTSNPPGQGQAAVFRIGHGVGAGNGRDDIGTYEDLNAADSTYQGLLRIANWDNVRNQLDQEPQEALPFSLYLTEKPAFFGSSQWPWVDPTGTTKIHELPAKRRFDAGAPMP